MQQKLGVASSVSELNTHRRQAKYIRKSKAGLSNAVFKGMERDGGLKTLGCNW